MPWHPDIPDLPIDKPKIIENLEQMDKAVLNSMPSAEVDEMIESVAYDIAMAYRDKFPNGSIEECFNFVSIALSVTGSSVGGKVGLSMVAASDEIAHKVCQIIYQQ